MLVNGTKEKNSFVKANCEFSLITVLKLREGDTVHQVTFLNFKSQSTFIRISLSSKCLFLLQECMKILDAGARDALNDVVTKVLKRLASTQFEGKEEDLDDTLLN